LVLLQRHDPDSSTDYADFRGLNARPILEILEICSENYCSLGLEWVYDVRVPKEG